MAIDIEKLEMVQFALSRGANPNLNHTMNNRSALEFAAVRTSIPVVEALLRAGSVFKAVIRCRTRLTTEMKIW